MTAMTIRVTMMATGIRCRCFKANSSCRLRPYRSRAISQRTFTAGYLGSGRRLPRPIRPDGCTLANTRLWVRMFRVCHNAEKRSIGQGNYRCNRSDLYAVGLCLGGEIARPYTRLVDDVAQSELGDVDVNGPAGERASTCQDENQLRSACARSI